MKPHSSCTPFSPGAWCSLGFRLWFFSPVLPVEALVFGGSLHWVIREAPDPDEKTRVNLLASTYKPHSHLHKWQRQTREPVAVQASAVGAIAGWRKPARSYPDNWGTPSVSLAVAQPELPDQKCVSPKGFKNSVSKKKKKKNNSAFKLIPSLLSYGQFLIFDLTLFSVHETVKKGICIPLISQGSCENQLS